MNIWEPYDEYLKRTFEISPMDESYKAVIGHKFPQNHLNEFTLRCVRGSFAQMSFALHFPQHCEILLEERPSFSHHWPVDEEQIVRASLNLEGLEGRLHIVDMVEDDDGLKKADIILDGGSFYAHPFQVNQLLLLVPIPAETKPGIYEGCVRFYGHCQFYDETLFRTIRVRIEVVDIALPARGEGKFHLNLWQHVFNIARKHEVPAYTDAHIEALRPYAKALGELGNKDITVLLSDVPWCGQRCYSDVNHPADLFEYNYVRIRRDTEGAFHYDFSFAEKYIALMKEYGAKNVMFTGVYGIWADKRTGYTCFVENWPDPIRLSYVDEKDGSIKWMRKDTEIEAYLKAVYQWIVERGLLETSYLMGDEVDLGGTLEGWSGVLERINRLMPGIHRYWDMEPEKLVTDEYKNERVDIYAPQLNGSANTKPEMHQLARERLQPGAKFLWSVCCWPPVMNSFLQSNLNEVRLHGLITEHVKLDGFLRWNFSVWPDDPRNTLVFFPNGWPAGDTCYVYPGRGGQCLKSLRYLALRRGIEDFELAQMVKESCANAESIIQKAVSCVLREQDISKWDFEDYWGREQYFSLNAEDYHKARDILLDALLEVKSR